MSEEVKAEVPEISEEEKRRLEDEEIRRIIIPILKDKEESIKFERALNQLRKRIGLLPLESKEYVPDGQLETVIYMMRWNPSFFMNCDLNELHESEMVLCAHIAWVKSRENRWSSAYKIESRGFERAVAKAAKYCTARSIDERRAEAISRSEELIEKAKMLDIYKLYADHCSNMSDTFIQMDNSLKQAIATRRIELESSRRQM